LADEIITGGKDDVSPTGVSHLGQNLTHADSNGGLTSTGGSSEAHVERRDSGFETELATHLIEDKQGSNLLNTLLHGDETNELNVKLTKLILDTLFEHEFIDCKS
jgi:hypothetical protein